MAKFFSNCKSKLSHTDSGNALRHDQSLCTESWAGDAQCAKLATVAGVVQRPSSVDEGIPVSAVRHGPSTIHSRPGTDDRNPDKFCAGSTIVCRCIERNRASVRVALRRAFAGLKYLRLTAQRVTPCIALYRKVHARCNKLATAAGAERSSSVEEGTAVRHGPSTVHCRPGRTDDPDHGRFRTGSAMLRRIE